MFKLTMKDVMAKPFDMNPVTKLWLTIINNSLLCQRLSEYMKCTKIAIVFVHLVQWKMNVLFPLMKDKLCNQLGPRLNMIVRMFAQEFFT